LILFDTIGFDDKTIEKIYRICDILQKIYSIDYTKDSLALYGGTSLNFLHFKKVQRLSLDIDFNYRDRQTGNWAEERDEIDKIVKKVLSDLHYSEDNIKIQAVYPITRFMIHYKTKNDERDSIKIEIGYMRRIPILEDDTFLPFTHLETGEESLIKTPCSEELFGNKFCTLLYRHKDKNVISSRDLFDVYIISKMKFDKDVFESTMVVDSLMRPEPRLYNYDADQVVDHVNTDDQLKNLLHNRKVPGDIKDKTRDFIKKNLSKSKERYIEIIDTFFDKQSFEPELLDNYQVLNSRIKKHPSILWNLEQLRG